MKTSLVYIFLFLFGAFAFAQAQENLVEEYQKISKQFRDPSITQEKAASLAKAYLTKAQKSEAKEFIGKAYYLIALKTENLEERLQVLDSAILYTKDLKNDASFPMEVYFLQGHALQSLNKYDESLKSYFLALSEAKRNDNKKYQNYIKYNIAFLKRILGNYEEAEVLLLECLADEESKDKLDANKYANILVLLSSVYFELGKIDACTDMNIKGIAFTKNNKNKVSYMYPYFVVNEGINLAAKGNYTQAIDSLKKGRTHLNELNQLTVDFYLAESYYALGEKERALPIFKKIDSSFDATNDMFIALRGTYTYLINEAKGEKDLKSQLYYTNRLIRVDSIIYNNYRSIYNTIKNDYDIPELIEERDETIQKLKEENETIYQKNKWTIIISLLIGAVLLFGFIYNYRLKKKYEKRYQELMDQSQGSIQEEISAKNVKPQAVSLGIDPEIVNEILKSLEDFEKGEVFLTNQISLKDVAKLINTNSKYLSKIINTYKGKNFATYINELRIEHLINHVKTETKYQKYTISAIAEEIGFTNSESFSRAFLKKTGLKPSYFIKKVRENSGKIT